MKRKIRFLLLRYLDFSAYALSIIFVIYITLYLLDIELSSFAYYPLFFIIGNYTGAYVISLKNKSGLL
jgi:hypothetical protein